MRSNSFIVSSTLLPSLKALRRSESIVMWPRCSTAGGSLGCTLIEARRSRARTRALSSRISKGLVT